MGRVASRFEETKKAIRDLVLTTRSPDKEALIQGAAAAVYAAAKAGETEDSVHIMLDALSVHRLFEALDDDQWVSRKVVAAYCDCSSLTLDRRLIRLYARPPLTWSDTLKGDAPPSWSATRGFRWGFVRAFLTAWDAERAQAQAPYKKKVPSGPRLMAAFRRRYRFLEHADGSIESAWGQGGTTAARLIAILDAGGHLVALTAMEALARPWANGAARAPWQDAVKTALDELIASVDLGAAQTSALAIEAVLRGEAPSNTRPGS